MHCAIKPDPHHLRDTAGIITVRLVDLRLQHRPHVPRLNTDHRQVGFTKRAEQPLRQRPRFQSDPLKAICRTSQYLQQSVGLARNLNLPNDFTRPIHNADARVLDRYVQSSKMVHAALLLMLGARTTATPFHHQPEAQHPKSFSYPQAAGRLPHLLGVIMSTYDAVDGAHSTASECQGWSREANHIEGSRPWARLARLVLILRSLCFRCTGV